MLDFIKQKSCWWTSFLSVFFFSLYHTACSASTTATETLSGRAFELFNAVAGWLVLFNL